jgi:hypothetical protein
MFIAIMSWDLKAQTVVYNEGFEGATQAVTSTSSGTNSWALSTSLYESGLKSDSCVVTAGDTTILTTDAFSTTGNTFVMLEFDNICKIEYLDAGIVEVSADNGATWTQLTGPMYLGAGQFGNLGNKFSSSTYVIDWLPSNNTAQPTNAWWKHETFDISSIAANAAQVKVRFLLIDGPIGNGAVGNRGWFLDNIEVTTALSELQPPTITYSTPMLQDSVFNFGPFTIQATITDASGIDTALLVYQRNSGAWDTIGMPGGGSTFNGLIDTIPPFATYDTVRYFVIAKDASLSHNVAREPAIGNIQFVLYTSPPPPGCTTPITTFPYIDDFENSTNVASPSCGTTYPVAGWTNVSGATNGWAPHSGGTTSSSTGPTGDHTSGSGKYLYTETSCSSGSYVAKLESPCFDLTGLSAPQLEFWYHMYGAAMGTFDIEIWYGGQWVNIWSKTGNQGNMWQKATVNLIPYKGVTKLRLIGTRGGSYTSDMAIDDIKIWVPPANDAGVIALNYPITPALSGTLPVYASFKNYGSANLTSVDFNWQINGVSQTTVNWSGLAPPMTTVDSLLLGTYTFTAGAPTIKMWTSSPNGSADGFTFNDTLTTSVVVCDGFLHGTYTVGTPTSDFADIVSAVSALNNCGIDSTVIFNIAPGTYNGQFSLGMVNGASDTSTITFQSSTGNPADVVVQYTSASTADNYVIKLDGAQYVTIKNITVKNNGTTYSYGIHLTNGANYNTIDGNIVRSGTTTYSYARGIVLYTGMNQYNTIINNDVTNAYYGLYIRGLSTTSKAKGNRIENNNIHDFYYYGIYSYYQDSVTIKGNYIHDGTNTNYYGIYASYNSNGVKIIDNKLDFSPTNYVYGIYCYGLNYNASGADTSIIANNMISVNNGSGNIYGLYISNGINSKILYNSVNITAGSNTSRALYQTSGTGGLIIKNNNFVHTGGGYAMYINTSAGVASCDYNNIYTPSTSTKYAYWGGDVPSLSSLQLSSGDNAHSVSVDPSFMSNSDLHAGAVGIFQAGTPVADIADDFDGDIRSTTAPCIGADEFVLLGDDAGIKSLISPVVTCPGDTANIIVELKNYGLDTLFTCNINWDINSVGQTAYSFNDTLLAGQSVDITLGTYVFSAGISYDINFWSTLPNGAADLQTSNDSLIFTGFKTAIPAGTYVVGPSSSADYSSLDSVIADLNAYGICGPVVFNIESGTYSSRIVLNNITGASAANTITIQSLTNDSSDVTINYAATSGQPAVISLSNMSYVTINALTFNITNNSAKASAYWGNSTHNTIKSCVFNLAAATSSTIYGFYFNSASIKYNSFINNKVVNGYYSVYARGGGSTNLGKGNQFIDNIFENTRYYGIYSYYQDSIIIKGNVISTSGVASYPRGLYCYYTDNAEISANNIYLMGNSYAYGIYYYYCDASSSNPGLITNNMINIQGGTGSNYGIYFGTNTHQKVSNNSIYINSSSTNSRCLYVLSGTYNEAMNNIFYNSNGYAAYYSSTSSFQNVDYNNYYTTGNNFAYYSGAKTSLSALQSASGKDAHSMDINPNFISSTDLHILSGAINESGTPLTYVTEDIDGEMRDTLLPDMGADEFTPAPQDISIYSIEMQNSFCAASMEDVMAKFINTGSDTINGNLNLQYSLDSGLTWVTESSSAIIAPLDTLDYTFNTQANLSSMQDTTFYIIVKGDLLNDPIAFNDTMSISVFNGMLPASPIANSGTATYAGTAVLTATSSSLVFWFESDTSSLPLSSGTSYTTGMLFDTTVYYCGAISTNGCYSVRVPDTAYVTGIPSGDVGVASIIVNEGCNVDSAETVSIKIYNQGYGTVSGNLTAMFKVDNGAYSTPENVTTSIGSNDTITYTFTNTANLYAYYGDTTFAILAKVTLVGDPYNANDTLTKSPVEVSYTPIDPVVTSPLSIGYGAMANLTATSSDTINWYNTSNLLDTVPFGTGSPVTVGPLYVTDSFYVQAVSGVGGMFTIGTGTTVGSTTSYPTPYGQWYTGSKEQYLIKASELYALGANGGAIESLAFDVVSPNTATSAGHNHDNYTIKLGNSSITSLTSWQSGLTQVYTTPTYQTVTGWNTHTFTTPFVWDGVSNIIVEVCFDNYVSGSSYSNNATVHASSTPFQSCLNYHSDGGGVCPSSSISGTYSSRPNMQLGLQVAGCASNRVELVVAVAPPPAIDAGMDSIVSPTNSEMAGSPVDIDVNIKNYGTNNLTSVDIVYELDSAIIDTFAWTGSLAFNAISSPITIYTDTFTPGAHNIRIWVQNANGNPTAGVNLNDTLTRHFTACLSGVYTLGDSTSDFPTFNDALNALNSGGVCGDVTFNIASGTYNTQIALQAVTGAGPNARITFQSATGDSNDVIIQSTPAAANTNYTLIFFGGSYYTVKNVTIKANGSYAHTVVYYNNASYNTVENCIVESTVATNSNAVPFYDFSSSISSFNTIRNNSIKNGYYGIYLYGPSSYAQKSFVVEDNEISGYYYYGIYSYYQDSTIFKYNKISNGANSVAYPRGMYLSRNRGPIEVVGNQINLTPSTYGYALYYYYCIATSTGRALVANNAITVDGGSSTSYGIYDGYSENVSFVHNSINLANTYTSSRAFYQTGGTNQEIINNAFAGGAGYAYYVNSTGAVSTSDYNDFYTTGTNFAYWSGNKASLSALKAASGKDAHSLNEEPFFYSNNNLHSGAVALNGTAFPMTSLVPMDMDKEMRSTTAPDIGADEFSPPPNDAGIVSVDAPVSPVNIGTSDVHVTIRNFGADTLTSANIAWSVNNNAQLTSPWTGSIISGATDDSLYIGSYNFAAGINNLKVWSESPNAATDGNYLNDTIMVTLVGCTSPMHGNYTIGGASADFASISDAVAQLNSCGVDSNVVFNINPGTYNEQIELGEIMGAADTATVTFQSSTLDSTDVTINYSATASNNYVVYLHGSDWIRFVNLSIEALNPTAGRVVVLDGGANNNIFHGNILTAPISTSSSSSVIYSGGDNDNYNTFTYNDILNGYYGVYYRGYSSALRENGSTFAYNRIDGYYYYGVYLYYHQNVVFDHNIVKSGASSFGYAMYLYYINTGLQISNNTIDARPSNGHYGMYMYYCQFTASNPGRVYNNFIGVVTGGSSTCYGIYVYNNTNQHITNNNILLKTSYTYSRGIYVNSGNNNKVLNNNVVMDGPGYVYYVSSGNYVSQSDHNNFYSTGSQFAYWSGAASDLTSLQANSGKDANSISVDPGYFSNYDLHVTTVNLNSNATPISYVTTDIDDELRDTLTPDIGADEFTPQQWDAAVVAFVSPSGYYSAQGTSTPIMVTLKNFGMDTITTMPVSYVYGNSTPITETWTGNLAPGDTISHLFATNITTMAGSNSLCAYTSLVADSNLNNDTLCMNYGGISLVVPTYADNFDTPPSMWVSAGSEWELGIPQGTNINTAYSAPNVWMTKLSSNYSDNGSSDLLSPYFDFTNASGATLKFMYNVDMMANDGVTMYYSTDGGSTWITLGYVGDPLATNWYTNQGGGNQWWGGQSSGWVQATYDLSQFNNSTTPIQFKLHFFSNGSSNADGFAIDNFKVELPPIPYDAGVVSIDAPASGTTVGSMGNTVTVTVKNFGTNTLGNIPIHYTINGTGSVNESVTVTGGLLPDSTTSFTFATTFQGPASDYNLCAFTSQAGDIYTSNDSACTSLLATTPPFDAEAAFISVSPSWHDTTKMTYNTVVTLRIKNNGSNAISSVPVQFLIGTTPIASETFTGTINPGDSADYTFTTTYHSPNGNYLLCGKTLLANDADNSNDQICTALLGINDVGIDQANGDIFSVEQNQPNPAFGEVRIDYFVPKAGKVRFELLNVLGQTVQSQEYDVSAGNQMIQLDANKLAEGVYYYTVEFDNQRITRKMVVNQ